MNVTATISGEVDPVTIVSMSVDRGGIYISYRDSVGNLKIVKQSLKITASAPVQLLGTSATVN